MLRGKKIGVIGAGNMGAALIRGWIQTQVVLPKHLRIADKRPETAQPLVDELGVVYISASEAIEKSDIVILAVKPQDIGTLLETHGKKFTKDHLLVSIAAGLRPAFIEARIEAPVPVVRVMPNLPVVVGAGASAYSLGAHASWPHGMVASLLFSAVGKVAEVDDEQMDAVTALSGSGPAYAFLLAELMAEAGAREGLPREIAGYLAVQTIFGGAKMMLELEDDPATLRRQVTSPGGTTAAALGLFEDEGLRELFCRGVHAARARSEELSAGK